MLELTGFERGVSVNRIITRRVILDLVRDSEFIQIVRSGVYFVLGHCADVIREACEASDRRKQIRIILPSIFNPDVVVRAREAGLHSEQGLARLGDWQETLAALAVELAPKHSLELRTTMGPHRYHAIFTETHGIVGVPWHTRASLTTSSFFVGPDATSVIHDLHEDFDIFWSKCTPYRPGDNERNRSKKPLLVFDDPVLHQFGRMKDWILEALCYTASAFPDANGGGVTKDHLHLKLGTDKSDCNKRLLAMERAGLLYRAGDNDGVHGRLVTTFGKLMADRYQRFLRDRGR